MVGHGHGNVPPSRRNSCKTQLDIDLSAAHVLVETSYKVHSDPLSSQHKLRLCSLRSPQLPEWRIATDNGQTQCLRENLHSAVQYHLVHILYNLVQLQFIPLRAAPSSQNRHATAVPRSKPGCCWGDDQLRGEICLEPGRPRHARDDGLERPDALLIRQGDRLGGRRRPRQVILKKRQVALDDQLLGGGNVPAGARQRHGLLLTQQLGTLCNQLQTST